MTSRYEQPLTHMPKPSFPKASEKDEEEEKPLTWGPSAPARTPSLEEEEKKKAEKENAEKSYLGRPKVIDVTACSEAIDNDTDEVAEVWFKTDGKSSDSCLMGPREKVEWKWALGVEHEVCIRVRNLIHCKKTSTPSEEGDTSTITVQEVFRTGYDVPPPMHMILTTENICKGGTIETKREEYMQAVQNAKKHGGGQPMVLSTQTVASPRQSYVQCFLPGTLAVVWFILAFIGLKKLSSLNGAGHSMRPRVSRHRTETKQWLPQVPKKERGNGTK